MAKSRPPRRSSDGAAGAAALMARPVPAGAPAVPLPSTEAALRWRRWLAPEHRVVLLLALTLLLAPALGVPNEELLQDTLKSIVVSFGALLALAVWLWQNRTGAVCWRFHPLLWLPLGLLVYALGSMVWSHTYLAGVEAVRWFIFSVLAWLGLNHLTRQRVQLLAWGIHWGAFVAALWLALQFWFDIGLFPQGPNPASTFVNRNFAAEYLICTVPFSLLLLLQAREPAEIRVLALMTSLNLVAILMTGTRSALIGLVLLGLLLPLLWWRCRAALAAGTWSRAQWLMAAGILLGGVVLMGSLETGNPKLREEHRVEQRGLTPLQRSLGRGQSMLRTSEYTEGSFSVRMVMWRATARMIADRPLSGVGAGAWEVAAPLYQSQGAQLETDYYVHNEYLQLFAEFGLVGWLFVLLLLAYLCRAAWLTWWLRQEAVAEAPLRAFTLSSLLLLLLISNAGFPWRMASTTALFALCLGILLASDARLTELASPAAPLRIVPGRWLALRSGYVSAGLARALLAATLLALVLAGTITQQAVLCEHLIVRAVKMALTISQSGQPNDPRWQPARQRMLEMLRQGIAINPHYRKITPMVADELARWGDWKNATWIWQSVVQSRPYVVAILTNIARGHLQAGEADKALPFLERARQLQPEAPAVRTLDIVYLSRTGAEQQAIDKLKGYLAQRHYDFDLINTAYFIGVRTRQWQLALDALALRTQDWPDYAVDGWLKTGRLYAQPELAQDAKALAAFQKALDAAPAAHRAAVLENIPAGYRERLKQPDSVLP